MKNKIKTILPILLVLLSGLMAAWPLFQPGFIPTHDGEYHLIRFHEFETMLKNGYWFPRWAPGLNSGYGVPLFNFNYPFPNYLGVFFHTLGFSLADSFKLTMATGYLAAIVFCFVWLSKLFPKSRAAAAAILFAYVPYWFIDIYVRGSVGEILALTFLMLSLAAIERGWVIIAALAVAGLILSHNILALIFLPLITIYLLLTKPKYWWSILAGLGIAAYFWLPALAEQKYVVGLNTVNYRDYFASIDQLLIPAWGSGLFGANPADEMSVQIGIAPLMIFVIAAAVVLKDKAKKNIRAVFFILLTIISIFLMLKSSLIFWQIIPLLSFTQYPWRFLSVLLPAAAFLAADLFAKFKKTWFICITVFLAIYLAFSYTRPVIYGPRSDHYYLSRPNFTDGTNSLGNLFSTSWSPPKSIRPKYRAEFVYGKGEIIFMSMKPLSYIFWIVTETRSLVRLNVLYYPGWAVSVDGQNQVLDYHKDGTLDFWVNPGTHHVAASFNETPLRMSADIASVLSLFWLAAWTILKK